MKIETAAEIDPPTEIEPDGNRAPLEVDPRPDGAHNVRADATGIDPPTEIDYPTKITK